MDDLLCSNRQYRNLLLIILLSASQNPTPENAFLSTHHCDVTLSPSISWDPQKLRTKFYDQMP